MVAQCLCMRVAQLLAHETNLIILISKRPVRLPRACLRPLPAWCATGVTPWTRGQGLRGSGSLKHPGLACGWLGGDAVLGLRWLRECRCVKGGAVLDSRRQRVCVSLDDGAVLGRRWQREQGGIASSKVQLGVSLGIAPHPSDAGEARGNGACGKGVYPGPGICPPRIQAAMLWLLQRLRRPGPV